YEVLSISRGLLSPAASSDSAIFRCDRDAGKLPADCPVIEDDQVSGNERNHILKKVHLLHELFILPFADQIFLKQKRSRCERILSLSSP
ncbi:MAG: hypothetical protein LUC27_03960, partial [Lachnospiraceae bacterium]|nr:hypothetical protein [Lachnospiraceae bacterium]